jgi:hypothetical protein
LQYRINRSALVVLLEQWERDMPAPQRHDVAERLSQWLGAMDAVRLNAALHAIEAHAASANGGVKKLDQDVLHVRYEQGLGELQTLVASISAPEPAPRGRAARLAVLPVQAVEAPVFAAQQKRYLLVQQQLAGKVAQLRARIRQALAKGSRQLQQLVALDEVMEQMLGVQEQKLWAGLMVFLERRWQYQSAKAAALPAVGLRAFEQDMQALLGAEMQVRLQPVAGLVEAAKNEK